jgi:small-conductance mechanosensitive channel
MYLLVHMEVHFREYVLLWVILQVYSRYVFQCTQNKVMNESVDLFGFFKNHDDILTDAAYVVVLGMVGVFLLHRLAKRFIYPQLRTTRWLAAVFGTLYMVVLAVTTLIALDAMNYDVESATELTVLLLIVIATLIFLILPYLPTLPYKKGDVVEILGRFGSIETITPFQTKLLTFDGKLITVLNSHVLGSDVYNHDATPNLRIDLKLELSPESNVEQAIAMLERGFDADERILEDPASIVYVINVDPQRIEIQGYCWTTNANWLPTRSDLWIQVLLELESLSDVSLALPKREIHMT